MRKHNTVGKSAVTKKIATRKLTIGIDLGDRSSRYCISDGEGEVLAEGSVATTKKGFAQVFGSKPRSRLALEVGTHSPWVSRYLADLGHEVIVANARRVRLITDSTRKDDRLRATCSNVRALSSMFIRSQMFESLKASIETDPRNVDTGYARASCVHPF